jgi:hypothetical protein
MTTVDPGPLLRALVGANVQFVVVGDPGLEGPLRLVLSAHPTNLDALGRALDGVSATARADELPDRHRDGAGGSSGPARVGDPLGTVAVTTSVGDALLLFGGAHGSLYAETLALAQAQEVAGVSVQWAAELPEAGPPPRITGGALGGRLLSLAGRLAHLVERRGDRPEAARADAEPADAERDGATSTASGPDAPAAPEDQGPPGAG